jgi:hypothetical protein
MFTVRITLLAMIFLPAVALAHQINGTIQNPSGQPVQNKDVEIRCTPPVNENQKKRTNNSGSFSFFISKTGRCTLIVDGATYEVYSSENPVRYDLILGGGMLRRR